MPRAGAQGILVVAPAPGSFLDTNGFGSYCRLACALSSKLSVIATSYDSRLQQWTCKPLMFLV